MKSLVLVGVVTVLSLLHVPAWAQARTIVYGRTNIQFSGSFQQGLASLGATVTDLSGNALKDGSTLFRATTGVIDLQTAVGEVVHAGGYIVSAGGTTITIQNLILDTTNPAGPVFTGVFSINSTVQGRFPVFSPQPPAGFSLPLQPQQGTAQINGFSLTLAPAAASIINGVFGAEVLPAGTAIGTADVYTVLSSDTDQSK